MDFFNYILSFFSGGSFGERILLTVATFFFGWLPGLIVGLVVGLVVCLIKYFNERKKVNSENNRNWKYYQEKLSNDNARIQRHLIEIDVLTNQRDVLIRKQQDSLNKLIQFYDKMGIDNNYRNLIPIGYMYDLCRLGVSNKLYGTDGLYYLVRKELRYDKLQYSLDEISSKLDTIISNQSSLYYEINDINNKCNNLLAQTKKSAELAAKNNQLVSNAVKNTSIANYHLQRIQAEAEYQNTMKWITNRW